MFNMLAYLQFVPLFTAFFVALILLVVMTPLAHQFGLVDQPSARKRHAGIIPLTGGVAIFMAVLVASVATDVWMKNNPLFFTASAFVVLLGLILRTGIPCLSVVFCLKVFPLQDIRSITFTYSQTFCHQHSKSAAPLLTQLCLGHLDCTTLQLLEASQLYKGS